MRLPRCAAAALAVAVAVLGAGAGAGAGTGLAQPSVPPSPVATPDTDDCPYRTGPPPPVDTSEAPLPGEPTPEPLPLPEEPVGGEEMGECGVVLPPGADLLPVGITATSWVIADLDTGAVLAAKDPHARHRPASTMKLLTALVAGTLLPPDRVVVGTQSDADQEGSSVGMGAGGRYTVTDLFAGLLMVSGNDAAHALAVALGGVPETLATMNARAAALGALDTRAASVSGLDAPGMSTSAYDLALIFREVLDQQGFAELLRTRTYQFPGSGTRPSYLIGNDNRLLLGYPGFLGGKTGFTDDARHTYVGAAERGGQRLVTVLLRAEQQPVRTSDQAAALLDYGFALPSNRPVGRLVEEAPETTTPPPPSSTTSALPPPVTAPGPAASAPPPVRDTGDAATLGWLLAGAGVVAVLVAVVHRQRRR
ncbi:MAG: D-alanyl-D-alanine carboxypeptidase [Actinomycetota bacterium]|nr:D-alanyl-D-alanine carboxypeptidase [Actinomycetota bacterium]